MAGSPFLLLLLGLALLLTLSSAFLEKVHPKVLADTEGDAIGSFSVHLKQKANFEGLASFSRKDHSGRGRFVLATLKKNAEVTQSHILRRLRHRKDVERVVPFYVANFIIVDGKRSVVEFLAQRPEVLAINSNSPFKVNLETPEKMYTAEEIKLDANEWNINYVKAPIVWEKYNTNGTGIYANADTGVDWTHPALYPNYKGVQGSSVNHNHNWWDGVKRAAIPGNGRCGVNSQVPCDDNSHGTHTTGTSVGQNGIGVAPGAKWIGCRNMDRGYGTVESYMSCLQFFLAPTDLQGNNADPDLRPYAIGNSYGCVSSEGCTGGEFTEAVEALRAAGIFMSVSAGNSGPTCNSIGDPPATEASVISVGATAYNSDAVAAYSSRGPVGTSSKPDIAAPGSSVRSCVPGGGYSSFSGTSMASPHVGAAVNLLVAVCPELLYDVDALQNLLESSARRLYTNQGCGGDSSSTTPNNVFGHGMLDLEAAAAQCSSKA